MRGKIRETEKKQTEDRRNREDIERGETEE
jgi:hypothetical protein